MYRYSVSLWHCDVISIWPGLTPQTVQQTEVLSLHLGTYIDNIIDQIDGAGFQFDELNYSILNRIVQGRITAVAFSNIALDQTLRLSPLFRTGTTTDKPKL